MLREERLDLPMKESQLKKKKQLASKEITLESLGDHEDIVRYFTGLTDFMTLAAIFNFVSTHLPNNKRRAVFLFQPLVSTFMRIRMNTCL